MVTRKQSSSTSLIAQPQHTTMYITFTGTEPLSFGGKSMESSGNATRGELLATAIFSVNGLPPAQLPSNPSDTTNKTQHWKGQPLIQHEFPHSQPHYRNRHRTSTTSSSPTKPLRYLYPSHPYPHHNLAAPIHHTAQGPQQARRSDIHA